MSDPHMCGGQLQSAAVALRSPYYAHLFPTFRFNHAAQTNIKSETQLHRRKSAGCPRARGCRREQEKSSCIPWRTGSYTEEATQARDRANFPGALQAGILVGAKGGTGPALSENGRHVLRAHQKKSRTACVPVHRDKSSKTQILARKEGRWKLLDKRTPQKT